jgi:RNA recognition motif-containing protein
VDNLTYTTVEAELRDIFGKFGEIGDIYIPR